MHHLTKNITFKIFDKTNPVLNGVYFDKNNQLISKNITYLKEYLNCPNIIIPQQIHSNNVMLIDKESIHIYTKEKIICDALVTNCRNTTLCIQTADCVPVLLFCTDSNIIGAAHCGWKGAKNDIIKYVTIAMKHHGAKNIKAIIGPSIQQECYNVKHDFYNHFIAASNKFKIFFTRVNDKNFLFDLPSFVQHKLKEEMIDVHLHIHEDTYSLPDKYHSYRYKQHNKMNLEGRILTCISLYQ